MTTTWPDWDPCHTSIATWFYAWPRLALRIAFDASLCGWMPTTAAVGVIDDFGNLVKVSA